MTIQERIKEKQVQLRNLSERINLYLATNPILTVEQRQDIQNEQFRLEFAVQCLLDESREKELDVKIKMSEDTLKILKQ